MKKVVITTGIIFLLANLLFGLIFTAYPAFNAYLNSIVILATISLILSLYCVKLKDAFRYSLTLVFGGAGVLEFILGCLSPDTYKNNCFLIGIILLFVIETAIYIAVKATSDKV